MENIGLGKLGRTPTSTSLKGDLSELIAAEFFLEDGWVIFWPHGNPQGCDFIITRGLEIEKIQVKSLYWTVKNEGTAHQAYYLRSTLGKCVPKIGDFDYIVLVNSSNRSLWKVPIAVVAGKTNVYVQKDGVDSHYNDRWRLN